MNWFPVIEGGSTKERFQNYADWIATTPASIEEVHSRLQLNLRHPCIVWAWFDERDRTTFGRLCQSHAAFGGLLDDLQAELAGGAS